MHALRFEIGDTGTGKNLNPGIDRCQTIRRIRAHHRRKAVDFPPSSSDTLFSKTHKEAFESYKQGTVRTHTHTVVNCSTTLNDAEQGIYQFYMYWKTGLYYGRVRRTRCTCFN
jgi:hypothetical protein